MRRHLFLVPLALLPLFALHCTSSTAVEGTDGGSPANDGSAPDTSTPQPDGSSSDAPSGDSTAPGDSSVDAGDSATDASDASDAAEDAAGPVTVTIVSGGSPLSGITVFFSDPTGALLFTDTTGATGVVSEVVLPGAQVTAVLPVPAGGQPFANLVTVTAVQPGDSLTLSPFGQYSSATDTITALPPDPPADTFSYLLQSGSCSTAQVTAFPVNDAIYGYEACDWYGQAPIFVTADSDAGVPLAFTYEKGLAAGASTAFDAGVWSTATTTQTVAVTNVGSLDAGPEPAVGVSFSEVADDVLLPQTSALTETGPLAAAFTGHTGYPDFVQSEVTVNAGTLFDAGGNDVGFSITAIATRADAPTVDGGASFDLTQLLPLITAVNVEPSDAGRPVISWTTNGSLAGTAGGLAQFGYFNPVDGGGSNYIFWTFIVPPTATSVQAPVAPSSVASYAPAVNAQMGQDDGELVVFAQGASLPGYSAVRGAASLLIAPTVGLVNPNTTSTNPIVPPLPADGTLQLTAFTNSGD